MTGRSLFAERATAPEPSDGAKTTIEVVSRFLRDPERPQFPRIKNAGWTPLRLAAIKA